MWLVIRLLIAIGAGVIRFLSPTWRGKPTGIAGGRAAYQSVSKTKSGKITGFRLGVGLDTGFVFDFHKESQTDHFFKWLGLSDEVQTGDSSFDQKIYVACDHLGLHDILTFEPRARAAILAALDAGYDRIRSDGRVLWMRKEAEKEPGPEDFAPLVEIAESLSCLERRDGHRVHIPRPFALRFIIVEAVVWSIFGYAASSWITLSYDFGWSYFEYGRLLWLGTLSAAFAMAALFGLIVVFLRGSSRAHRILVESGILLTLALPVTGVSVVSDINANARGGAPVRVDCEIVSKQKVTRRKRRGGKTTDYYINLAPPASRPIGFDAPRRVQVDYGDYAAAEPKGTLIMQIEPGALGIPWIADRTVRPPVGPAPAPAPAPAPEPEPAPAPAPAPQ